MVGRIKPTTNILIPRSTKSNTDSSSGRAARTLAVVILFLMFGVFLMLTPGVIMNEMEKTLSGGARSIDETKLVNLPSRAHYSQLIKHKKQTSTSSTKRILSWTTIFTRDFLIYLDHQPVTSHDAFSQCPEYTDCEWTIDRSKLNESDAVLFHFFPADFKLNDLPPYHLPFQKWVYFNLEPPIRFQEGMMANVDDMFNLTATYEDDADVPMPYGYYYRREKIRTNYLPPHSSRNKSIVWMASRCSTLSRREVYVQDLKRFIDIDIFGDCGRPAPTKGSPPINIDFRTELAKKYYFYLAFENSDCEDYITEKFWSSLMAGLVPIVRGQLPRYEKHAPPGSYIHADAFFSYEDLAKYLKYLIDHPAEYNKYFEWRKHYDVQAVGAFMNLDIHCQLCRLLHTKPDLQQSYKMSEHYARKNKCFNYHDNLPMIEFEMKKAYNDELKDFLPIKPGS